MAGISSLLLFDLIRLKSGGAGALGIDRRHHKDES